MPIIDANQPLLPSVLDRLIDQAPGSTHEVPGNRGMALRDLKECLRRDLENLLNTRWRCFSPPAGEELETSLANYGIPDCAGTNLGAEANRDEFRRLLQSIIRKFEPRLKNVRVTMIRNDDAITRTLQFRIEGVLMVQPSPEAIAFSSLLEPCSGSFKVKGDVR